MEDLETLSAGSIKIYDFQDQYKNVSLGNDFYDVASAVKSCDSLKIKMGKLKSHFIPISDEKFFKHSIFTKIYDLTGFVGIGKIGHALGNADGQLPAWKLHLVDLNKVGYGECLSSSAMPQKSFFWPLPVIA